MRPLAVTAIAGATAAVGGYCLARATVPTKVVEKTVTVEKRVEVAAKTQELTNVETKAADVRSETHWRIHYVARPDGTVVATASSDTGERETTTAKHDEIKRDVEIRYVDREKATEKIVIKEASRPDWAVTAGAALRGGYAQVYQGGVERRILGPFWLGLYGSTAKEIGADVRFEW